MNGIYKYNIIRALEHLSSYAYQRMAWFPNTLNIVDSYLENIEEVFDDSGLYYFWEQDISVFGDTADDALRDLEKATDTIDTDIPAGDIIDSPQMQSVREKANYALRLVESSTSDMGAVPFLVWIHVPILDGNISRHAIAEELPSGLFKILRTHDAWHDYPTDEQWKFNPGDIVDVIKTDEVDMAGNKVIRAVALSK